MIRNDLIKIEIMKTLLCLTLVMIITMISSCAVLMNEPQNSTVYYSDEYAQFEKQRRADIQKTLEYTQSAEYKRLYQTGADSKREKAPDVDPYKGMKTMDNIMNIGPSAPKSSNYNISVGRSSFDRSSSNYNINVTPW